MSMFALTLVFNLAVMGKIKKQRRSSISQFFTLRAGSLQSQRSVEGLCVSTFMEILRDRTWLMDPCMVYLLQQEASNCVSPPYPRHAHSLTSFSFSSSADGGSEDVSDLRSASLDPHHSFAGHGRIPAVAWHCLTQYSQSTAFTRLVETPIVGPFENVFL